jgi:hypothetical protein
MVSQIQTIIPPGVQLTKNETTVTKIYAEQKHVSEMERQSTNPTPNKYSHKCTYVHAFSCA